MKMNFNEINERLKAEFPDSILESKPDAFVDPYIVVKASDIKEICAFLSTSPDLKFDYLMSLSGMDYNDGTLGVVYHIFSMEKKHRIVLKVKVKKDLPEVPSVESIWKSANWHEREAYDLFGIIFVGHPDLRRILLPYDWDGHPLRKDYKVQEYYQGMKVPY
ncbi:MAG: NADH-quinone oxidoreductase subunit C [Candidatus Kryptoniota bacterium]